MRLAWGAALALLATSAAAAELPLATIYGTPSGCAYLLGGLPVGGPVVAINSKELLTGRVFCTYETVEPAAAGWRVSAACAEGENVSYRLITEVAERPGFVDLNPVSGKGPVGEFAACGP